MAGTRNHAPAIAVFTDSNVQPKGGTNILDLASFSGQCELIIEVVQPPPREADVVAKFDHYYRIGIPYHVIVDQEGWLGPRELRAYRWTESGNEAIEADAQGRVLLPPVCLMLGMRDEQVVCFMANGERMVSYLDIVRALEIATTRQALAKSLGELLDQERRGQEEARAFGRQIEETFRQLKELKELDANLRR